MDIQRKFMTALLAILVVVGIGVSGYQLILNVKWLDALYMTVITLSTVGFGETLAGLDHSSTGRIFTMFLILMGTGTLVYFASVTTAFFIEGELTNILRRRKMDKEIAKLGSHTVVCGIGNTGVHVAAELTAIGEKFVVIDQSQPHLDHALERCAFLYITGDASDETTLQKAGITSARGIIISLGSDKDNLFVTFTARQLNPDARIVTRGFEPAIRDRLLRAGANAVVIPNQIGGMRLISELIRPHVVGFLDRMLRPAQTVAVANDSIWRIEEIEITANSRAAGSALGELGIEKHVGIPILAVMFPSREEPVYYPKPDTRLEAGSRLVVMAEKAQVARLREIVSA